MQTKSVIYVSYVKKKWNTNFAVATVILEVFCWQVLFYDLFFNNDSGCIGM